MILRNFGERKWLFSKNSYPEGKFWKLDLEGGRDAKALIKRGYDYVGTDISTSLIKLARKRNPKTIFKLQSAYDLSFPKSIRFDGFWASAVFLHIPKARVNLGLNNLKRFIRRNGVGFISLKEGSGERMEELRATGKIYERFFAYYQIDEFKRILLRNRFRVLKVTKKKYKKVVWLSFFVRV